MAIRRSRHEELDDCSLLYELSLAVGTSLDLEANCRTFVERMVALMDLDRAVVWLRMERIEDTAAGMTAVCEHPAGRAPVRHLPAHHPVSRLQPEESVALRPGDEVAAGLFEEHDEEVAACAVLPLGTVGFLQVVSRHTSFPKDERNQLYDVMQALATSIEACLAHSRLREEVHEWRPAVHVRQSASSLLRALIENMQDGVIIEDEAKRIVLVNDAFCRIFGAEAAPSELVGMDCTGTAHRVASLFHDPEAFVEGIEKAERERKLVRGRELYMKDGRVLEYDYVPILAGGTYRGHLWQYRDITERKQAEGALQASEARYKQLVEEANDIIYQTGIDGRFTYANATAQRLMGYPEDELLGMHYLDLVRPDYHEEMGAFYRQQIRSRQADTYHEFPAVTRAGQVMWLGQNVRLLWEGSRITGAQAVARDITQRKEAEEALERRLELENVVAEISTQFIKLPAEAVDEAIEAALGRVGRFVGADRSYLFLFDEGGGTMSNTHEWCAAGIESGRRDLQRLPLEAYSWWVERMRSLEPVVIPRVADMPEEATTERATFEEQDIASVVAVPLIEGGGLIGFAGFDACRETQSWSGDVILLLRLMGDAFVNALQRKRTETELRRAKQVAEESARAKERFLANMSHEIRTPLNAVVGMTHLLRTTEMDDNQLRYLNNIQFSADNLLALVNDLLDIAKLDAGKVDFESVPFDLRDFLEQLDGTMRVKASEKGLAFVLDADEALPHVVVGDPTRLSQILLNLVSNAIKFTEAGSVNVRVTSVEADAGRQLCFEIEDTGIGIPDDQLDYIFESFTQARSDTTRKYGGTGLGLAIVKELTERQDGRVDVVSREGVGTTFSVTLPLPEADDEVQTRRPDPVDGQLPEGTVVLLVEDNEMNQLVAQELLEHWGASVTVVSNGRQAVDRVAEGEYDLVLMDVQMPVMDGVEATRRIREELGRSREALPVLALTASVTSDQRDELSACGMNDFVLKPFKPGELLCCITRYLKRPRTGATHPSSETGERPVDLTALERNAFDEEFVTRMIDLFLEQTPGRLSGLREAATAGDWQRVRAVAHQVKSSAGMLGADALQRLLAEIERCVDTGTTDDIPSLAVRTQRQAEHVYTALRRR